ncbi:hypothetical protein N7456_008063 [Penicillium angulare]|uniref:F-box domain-containing protein n=1 Tax=Penicillium angulare TaxID=116970 RepID=A0A9W9FCC8_9EURO|nr:hypothetical protein N7456_008063 [Penicillium angulare]
MGLDELPVDIILLIAKWLHKEKDISAFARTTRSLHDCLNLYLCQYNVRHNGGSALLWASRFGYTLLANLLFHVGADIAAFEHKAERHHEFDIFENSAFSIATHRKRDINEILEPVENPLLLAAKGNHISILRLMLSQSSKCAATGAQLRTVLHWAIRSHNDEITQMMISSGAPLDPAGEHKEALSALGVAVESRCGDYVPRLLKHGAQPGGHECPNPLDNAILTNQMCVAEELLKAGIWLTSDTGLIHIALSNDTDFLQMLLDYGLFLNPYGFTALLTAILYDNYESVKFMLDKGLKIDVSHEILSNLDTYWSSAIGLAIRFRNLDILKLLIGRGFSPEQKDLDFAKQNGYTEELAILSVFDSVELSDKTPLDQIMLWAPQDTGGKIVPLSLPFIMSRSFELGSNETLDA